MQSRLGQLRPLLVATAIGLMAGVGMSRASDYNHLQAFAVCVGVVLVPAMLAVLADPWLRRKLGPLVSYAAGLGFRGGVAFGGAGAAFALKVVPKPAVWFWGWFLASYLVALICETLALVAASPKRND